MTYEIQVNAARRTVEITPPLQTPPLQTPPLHIGSRIAAVIDGRNVVADAARISPGVYSVLLDGRSLEVTVEETKGGLLLRTGGREFQVDITDPRAWRRRRGATIDLAGRQQVAAPMPGKIVRILVAPGQQVEAGQGLLVVEAMKMQNEIRSPKSGTVERLVREGQTVSAGEIVAVVA